MGENMKRSNIVFITDILRDRENITFSVAKAPQVTDCISRKLWKWCICRIYALPPLDSF
jgi:hypothetical protein